MTRATAWVSTLGVVLLVPACGADTEPPQSDVLRTHLSDRYPSTTASDWVTYGDVVAVVKVTGERRGEPSEDALKVGKGEVPRTVTFAVQDVVWERPGVKALPTSLEHPALGWRFEDGNVKDARALVADDRPSLRRGHTYVVAFAWQEERCYEGDGVIPARWVGLGAGSSIPLADGVLGAGEFAGEDRDLETARADAQKLPEGSVAGEVVGGTVEEVKTLLADATATAKGDYGPAPSDC